MGGTIMIEELEKIKETIKALLSECEDIELLYLIQSLLLSAND